MPGRNWLIVVVFDLRPSGKIKTDEPLDVDTHKAWLWRFLERGDGAIYIVEIDKSPVGQIRLQPNAVGEFIIDIYRPFWKVDSAKHIAPELIVVSDLLSTSDPRNVDAARRVMNEYLD